MIIVSAGKGSIFFTNTYSCISVMERDMVNRFVYPLFGYPAFRANQDPDIIAICKTCESANALLRKIADAMVRGQQLFEIQKEDL